jgi:anti-sigma B factor antagonist
MSDPEMEPKERTMSQRIEGSPVEESVARSWRIDLHGDLDVETAPKLREELDSFARQEAMLVIVDLADVAFLDSSGLRALVHGARTIEDAGGRLLVEGASGAVARVLELTDLLGRLSGRDD